MSSVSTPDDYKVDIPGPKNVWSAAVEEFLQLLARAVRQFHTYPPTSSMCTDAIAACHKAFAALDRSDRLELLILPHEFVADEVGIGAGTMIEHELVRRLHKAHVASLDIDKAASPRDFTRFCTDVIRSEDLAGTKTSFAELLAEHGVELIAPRMARRPEVLDVGARPAHVWDLVQRDRARRQTGVPSGPVQYLYPPEKGWVRLESGTAVDTVSLVDLAVLVDDPADIATILLRLTDDDPVDDEAKKRALEQKFVDVARLFAALDVHLARVMFNKLARAVLSIDPERRKALLQRTILPGLLDGRADGAVLRDFPDADLAESLCLLLDLETAAPEVVSTALQRLDLPAERARAVASLVDDRLQNGPATSASGGVNEGGNEGIDRFARRLIRIDSVPGKHFAEFAAFDLSIDEHAAAAIAAVGPAIAATDAAAEQIDCLWRLVRLEPSPVLVESFLRRAMALFADLHRAGRRRDLAIAARMYRQLASELKESRPDVADAIVAALASFCTAARTLALVAPDQRGGDTADVTVQVVNAFGDTLALGLVALLDDPSLQQATRSFSTLICEHAKLLAPGLVPLLGRSGHAATRVIVRACGYAGAGYEVPLAEHLDSRDEQTIRETLRALARIGTARAATLVGAQIQNGSPMARAAAEEALWHFPPGQTMLQLRDILGQRGFVVQNPAVAARLIERATQAKAGGLDHVLQGLEALRFRFWNPSLVRVALKAREHRVR